MGYIILTGPVDQYKESRGDHYSTPFRTDVAGIPLMRTDVLSSTRWWYWYAPTLEECQNSITDTKRQAQQIPNCHLSSFIGYSRTNNIQSLVYLRMLDRHL